MLAGTAQAASGLGGGFDGPALYTSSESDDSDTGVGPDRGIVGTGILGGPQQGGNGRPLVGDDSIAAEVVKVSQNTLNAVNHADLRSALHSAIGKQPDTVFAVVTAVTNGHNAIHAPLPNKHEDNAENGPGLLGKPSMSFFHILGPEPFFGDYFKTVEESELAFNQLFTLHPDLMTQTAIGKQPAATPDQLAKIEQLAKSGTLTGPALQAALSMLGGNLPG
ncbi:hypothetical protein ACFXKR_37130 [Streptomyces violascens]|uniref:hypothetical protein n=1 Tax=Streptomyces violascens TaxID=67381 RepID=UPI003695691E